MLRLVSALLVSLPSILGASAQQIQPKTCAVSPGVTTLPQLRKIRLAIRAQKHSEASSLAQAFAEESPSSAQALLGQSEALAATRQLAAAVTAVNRASQLDPCDPQVHYDVWRMEVLAGDPASAAKHLEIAHQLAPSDPNILRTWSAVHHAEGLEQQASAPALSLTSTSFFAKSLDCHGIPVRSTLATNTDALYLACEKVTALLANLPDAAKRLHQQGAELHIIGAFEQTTDMPENRSFKSSTYIDAEGRATNMDERARGVGGLKASCGEENLLFLPEDRYSDGSDICTHEFSHALRNFGLTDRQRHLFDDQYVASLKAGLWKNAYAAVNPDEFFAEITMWYFGTHGQFVPGGIQTPGQEALQSYDPAAYALLRQLYGNSP